MRTRKNMFAPTTRGRACVVAKRVVDCCPFPGHGAPVLRPDVFDSGFVIFLMVRAKNPKAGLEHTSRCGPRGRLGRHAARAASKIFTMVSSENTKKHVLNTNRTPQAWA